MALTDRERTIVATLIPITLIWNDFLEKHEFVDKKHPIKVDVDHLMELVNDTNMYAFSMYQQSGVTQEEWDELAEEVSNLLTKEGENSEGNNPTGAPRIGEEHMGEDTSSSQQEHETDQ